MVNLEKPAEFNHVLLEFLHGPTPAEPCLSQNHRVAAPVHLGESCVPRLKRSPLSSSPRWRPPPDGRRSPSPSSGTTTLVGECSPPPRSRGGWCMSPPAPGPSTPSTS